MASRGRRLIFPVQSVEINEKFCSHLTSCKFGLLGRDGDGTESKSTSASRSARGCFEQRRGEKVVARRAVHAVRDEIRSATAVLLFHIQEMRQLCRVQGTHLWCQWRIVPSVRREIGALLALWWREVIWGVYMERMLISVPTLFSRRDFCVSPHQSCGETNKQKIITRDVCDAAQFQPIRDPLLEHARCVGADARADEGGDAALLCGKGCAGGRTHRVAEIDIKEMRRVAPVYLGITPTSTLHRQTSAAALQSGVRTHRLVGGKSCRGAAPCAPHRSHIQRAAAHTVK